MKRSIFFVLFFCVIIKLWAQDYLISFRSKRAETGITSVKVENIDQGMNLIMPGSQILHLRDSITGIPAVNFNPVNEIRFYPNPMSDYTLMEFDMPVEATTRIELFDISGRIIIHTHKHFEAGRQFFFIRGLQTGTYIVRISAGNYLFSGKLLAYTIAAGSPEIIYQETNPLQIPAKGTKSISSETEMQYNEGDRLKFTATHETLSTVIVDVPVQSKELVFNLVDCTDAGGRSYPVVQIGNQIWMAENLAYLPEVYPSDSTSQKEPLYYVLNYQGFDVAAAKNHPN